MLLHLSTAYNVYAAAPSLHCPSSGLRGRIHSLSLKRSIAHVTADILLQQQCRHFQLPCVLHRTCKKSTISACGQTQLYLTISVHYYYFCVSVFSREHKTVSTILLLRTRNKTFNYRPVNRQLQKWNRYDSKGTYFLYERDTGGKHNKVMIRAMMQVVQFCKALEKIAHCSTILQCQCFK